MNDPNTNRYSLIEMVMPLVSRFQKTFFVPADRFRFDLVPAVGTKLKDTQVDFIDRTNSEGCDNSDIPAGSSPPH